MSRTSSPAGVAYSFKHRIESRRHIGGTMRGFGEWLQLPVFRFRLSQRRGQEFETRLRELIEVGEDHVPVIDVGPAERTALAVESVGKTFSVIEREVIVT